MKTHTKSIYFIEIDMSFSYSYRKLFMVVLMIMLAFLVVSPPFGAACRPFLLKDEMLLKLQKGTPVISSPDPIHTWNEPACMPSLPCTANSLFCLFHFYGSCPSYSSTSYNYDVNSYFIFLIFSWVYSQKCTSYPGNSQ